MIIKIEAVPKLAVEDGVEKVVMGANNQPVWDSRPSGDRPKRESKRESRVSKSENGDYP